MTIGDHAVRDLDHLVWNDPCAHFHFLFMVKEIHTIIKSQLISQYENFVEIWKFWNTVSL